MRNRLYMMNWEGMMICLAVVALGICVTRNIYGFYIMPDEYTYWSYAAYAAGYDWSETVALGPYFSYGYSIFLYPVFIIFQNSMTAYRVAVWINFALLVLAYILLNRIGRKALTESKRNLIGTTAVSIFLPCYFFYAQTTMTETLILVLYLVVCRLLCDYLENNRTVTLLLLTAALMYLYIVHMRTVGVLVSALIVLVPHFYKTKKGKTHFIICVSMLVLLLIGGNVIKNMAYQKIYGGINSEFVSGNDYGGQMDKIQYLLTGDGFYDFFVSLLGKVLYLGLASFGLFYFGTAKLIKKARKNLFSLETFVLATIVTQIGVSTVYLLTLGEICDYTYGRYNEFVLLIPMLYGISELQAAARDKRYGKIILATAAIAVMQLFVTVIVVRQTLKTGADRFQGFFITGISYLYDENNFSVETFYNNAYLINTALMLAVVLVVVFSSTNMRRVVLYGIVVLEICLSIQLYRVYMKPYRIGAFRDISMADAIERLNGEGYAVYYLDSKYPAAIGMIQFLKRELPIHVIYDRQYEPESREKTLYIMDYEDTRYEMWKTQYGHYDIYGHFAILYD